MKHKLKQNGHQVSAEKLAAKAMCLQEQYGSFALTGEGENLCPPRLVLKPEEEVYLKSEPTDNEREKRLELYRLASHALELSHDLRPKWCEALEVLKNFCDGKGGFEDLIIARMSLEPTLAGVWIGLNHERCNAAAALACYHACNPNLTDAIKLTNDFHQSAVKWAVLKNKS